MIKNNIDLTSNEMFSRQVDTFLFIKQVLYYKFPWNYKELHRIECETDLQPKFEGILTGNREEINSKKLYMVIDSGDVCDRCGISLKSIPWDRTYNLCKKCYKALEKEYGKKFPWL